MKTRKYYRWAGWVGLGLALSMCGPPNPYWSREVILARQQALNGFLGESRVRVVKGLGEPLRLAPDGEGGQVMTWERWDEHGVAKLHVYVTGQHQVYFWRMEDPSGQYSPTQDPTPTNKKP